MLKVKFLAKSFKLYVYFLVFKLDFIRVACSTRKVYKIFGSSSFTFLCYFGDFEVVSSKKSGLETLWAEISVFKKSYA